MLINITKIKRAGEEYGRCVDTLDQLPAVRKASEELRKGKGKSGGAQGEGASDKRAVAVEAPGLPPAEGWKADDTTCWEQEGCDLNMDLGHADALAAKGLPDDGSNRSESFQNARRAAFWKANQLVRPEQGQEAAEQAETSKHGQQALEYRGPDALPKKLMSAAPTSWSRGGATSVLFEAFPLRMLRGYLPTVRSVAFGSQPAESVVFAYYRLGLGLGRRSLRRRGALRRSASVGGVAAQPSGRVTLDGSRCSSSKCLEQFLRKAPNCGCLARRVLSQKMACARGWRRAM